ncbi:MAG: circularly permuted type 2 ATP-grasp protein [Pseudomonadota bacterium]
MAIDWKQYQADGFFDELVGPRGGPRRVAGPLCRMLGALDDDELQARKDAAMVAIRNMGITFTVYSAESPGGIDREWPFDIIPRTINKSEWERVETGLKQRVEALNHFINDLYNDQHILNDGTVDREVIANSKDFREQCMGMRPPEGVWAHVCGTDLVRHDDGKLYVLEDNLRVPSGVAYMIENREIMKRIFPELFEDYIIRPVDDYPTRLFDTLASLVPDVEDPTVAVLTPGIYNSAYFEHSFLAQEMGAYLVEGKDLLVDDNDEVYVRTIGGLDRVHVVYRRIDDLFMDPEVFREDSALGATGLMRAWRAGKVAIANAPGCGVADDKLVYTYSDAIIRYYLEQDPILPVVPTFRCHLKTERDHVLEHLDALVVKPVSESGGYGMLIGPQSTKAEREQFARKIRSNPRNFVAQPMLKLSTAPTVIDLNAAPRHLDLRPFILSGAEQWVTAGGLTRVALVEGSTVVNSSQGGGSKDTWIVDDA